MSSRLENKLDYYWNIYAPDEPPLTPECHFHPERAWRFDRALIDKLIAIESHGGGFVGGRHGREAGMSDDFQKHNAATALGWRLFYCTTSMLNNDPESIFAPILELMRYPVLAPNAELTIWTARVRNLTRIGDSIANNGIRVTRAGSQRFTVETGSGHYVIRANDGLAALQQQVLDLILGGVSAASTPSGIQKQKRAFAAQLGAF